MMGCARLPAELFGLVPRAASMGFAALPAQREPSRQPLPNALQPPERPVAGTEEDAAKRRPFGR